MRSIFSLSNIVSEAKYSIRLALPLIASEIVFALSSFLATAMIAHLSKEELAANVLVWNIYTAVILFFIGIIASVSIMVAQSFGAKDYKGITICFKQGLILALIFSLPMMLLMWFIPETLAWAKQDPAVILYAKPFFRSLVWVMLPLNIIVIINQFLVGIGKAKLVLFASIITVPIDIFFFYAFLFGKFGLPQMGLPGIGYGLLAADLIIIALLISYLHFSPQLKKYNLFEKWWVIEKKFLFEMFRIGIPLGLMWGSEVTFFALVAIMMGTLGVNTLAAYQIANQYLMIALVILFALSHNTAIRVGYEVGRNDRSKLKLTTAVNMAIAFILISGFSLFYVLFPETAISLDIDINAIKYQEVVAKTIEFFPLVAILLITDCGRIIVNGALRGLKDSNFQLMLSIFGFWLIAFPSSYFFAFKLGYGGAGIWWGIITGLFITGIILMVRFGRLVNQLDLSSLVTKK
ncbi:MAG: MATE family efflux transporter [Gammaproteobacteria bacterium]|nr:MATE family efflux transporter [Gammaproteobacteria bacterium]